MQKVFAGYCPLCAQNCSFEMQKDKQYRSLRCDNCGSWPRQRALWVALNGAHPNWRDLEIHEGSPGWDLISRKLAGECRHYSASQFTPSMPSGHVVTNTRLPCGKYTVQNLEAQTFADQSFDLVVTQDVFEHIFDPARAISEIARTLKPGGATLMSVPVVRKFWPSRRRARLVNGEIVQLLPPEYHGNPVSADGALVTIDWGFDIAAHLASASGMYFVMQTFDNMDFGIRDECNQILVGRKSPLVSLT
jgi:SAM-dependent methyltransferase